MMPMPFDCEACGFSATARYLDAAYARSRKLVGQVGHCARSSVIGIPADHVGNQDALIRKQQQALASISILLDHQGRG
jgi:hypothetical protein